MAIDTVISNDELVVIGPPASVTVNVDVGPKGDRGSIFYTGYGVPNPSLVLNPQIGDLYINRQLGGNYGVVYRYSAVAGGASWQSILRFQPIAYSIKKPVTFTAGSGSVSIKLADFYENAPETLDADSILVQVTSESNLPSFISVADKDILDIDSTKTFIVALKGAEFSPTLSEVSSISGSTNISLFITAGLGE